MSGSSPDDLRTSDGEVVRRVDLDRAAGTPGKFHEADSSIAGYDGVELARAALAGDRAALDEFRDLAGLVLTGVTEHNDGHEVKLIMLDVDTGEDVDTGKDRAAFQALNEGGHNSTNIDAAELVAWILSAEGRAALARRGVAVDSKDKDAEIARLKSEIERLTDEKTEIDLSWDRER